MKTISKIFFLLNFLLISFSSFAASVDLSFIILGRFEPLEIQKEIDINIIEVLQLDPGQSINLSIYREMPEGSIFYQFKSDSEERPVNDLLFEKRNFDVTVPGFLEKAAYSRYPHVLADREKLSRLSKLMYPEPDRKRLLIIYSHGRGADGLKGISLKDLKKNLLSSVPSRENSKPLDLLWFNSCFMASLETSYELRELSQYIMGSEDAEFASAFPHPMMELQSSFDSKAESIEDLASGIGASYLASYTSSGSQRESVIESPATISLIETDKLPALVDLVQNFRNSFRNTSDELLASLRLGSASRNVKQSNLADLGLLLKDMAQTWPETAVSAQAILDLIEYNRHQQSPIGLDTQVLVNPPEGSLMVFGFNNWSRGFEGDDMGDPAEEYVLTDYDSRSFPVQEVRGMSFLTPFRPGFHSFSYYFIDPLTRSRISETHHARRQTEVLIFRAEQDTNPIRFSGYTSLGRAYSGLNLFDPSSEDVNPQYFRLEFSQKLKWAGLFSSFNE